MDHAGENGEVWRQHSRRRARFWWAYLVITVAFLTAVVVVPDVLWGTRVGAVGNVVFAFLGLVDARGRTMADADGLVVRQLRERRIPWNDVAATQSAADRDQGPTRVRQRDGRTVKLPGVRGEDLDLLDRIRRGDR
ncbi:hypothetical protein [uncultured Serinicoccus sp.]|uniref:hypothetical protein n=1 Tax=uncultured Serinicoccus sp. TaxID=735514 RepID=UPI002610D381|nr:hypothetical protein [uncultured Serinicoccus sp.]